MSVKSQEHSMRRLAALLGQDLSYIGGDWESGSNGNKKTFLNPLRLPFHHTGTFIEITPKFSVGEN